jgi:hypothetical protein
VGTDLSETSGQSFGLETPFSAVSELVSHFGHGNYNSFFNVGKKSGHEENAML